MLVTHIVSRNAMGPASIGGDVFGKAAGSGGHDAVAGLDITHLAADRLDLAWAFQPNPCPDAANAAMLMARRHKEIGAIKARRPYPDKNLVGLWLRLWQVADFSSFFTQNGRTHD